jgi:hypothetical protein
MVARLQSVVAVPVLQPTEAATYQTPSALESTFMAGAAIALWSAWEVQSQRAHR